MTSTGSIVAIFVLVFSALQFASGLNCRPEEPQLKVRKERVDEQNNGSVIYKGRVFKEGEYSERKGFVYICKCDVTPCMKTCSDLEKGEFFPPENGFEINVELEDGSTKKVDFYKHFHVYSETRDCTLFTLEKTEYKILANGSFIHDDTEFSSSVYCVAMEKTGMLTIKMCEEDLGVEETEDFYETTEKYTTYSIEMSVSACFLLLTIVVILASCEGRTMLGMLSVCFCTTVAIVFVIHAVILYSVADDSSSFDESCTPIAFILLIAGLGQYCWLTSMCLEFYLSERDKKVYRFIAFAILSTVVPSGLYLFAYTVHWIHQDFVENCKMHDIPLLTHLLDWPGSMMCIVNFVVLAVTVVKQRLVEKWIVINCMLTILMIVPPLSQLVSTHITEISFSTKVILLQYNCLRGVFVFLTFLVLLLPNGCCSKRGIYTTQQQN